MPQAFIIMPFMAPIGDYYGAIYKPALEDAGFNVVRADDLFAIRPIIDDIRSSILTADLLLADLTGRNPNVFYELGLAHAIGKPVILVAQNLEDVPFDLRHVRVIEYSLHDPLWPEKLRQRVKESALSALSERVSWPPPLLQASPPVNLPAGIAACLEASSIDVFFREANGLRNVRKEEAIHAAQSRIRLQAKTGFSYFAPFGNRFFASLEDALSRGASLRVVLYGGPRQSQSPEQQKYEISIEGLKTLYERYTDRVDVRLTAGSPACTTLIIDNGLCFFEPYLPLASNERETKLINTFEILVDSRSTPFASFEAHFEESWANAEAVSWARARTSKS